ncbi:beta-ketoacyl synthase N-terminal-like domain-containing protein [Promicromonospora sp. NPDC060271]|uniref:beta-ketoacyl synthase N-terminal-like domain-containing protein n=1 Tax=Promicromonospora sp. NPDC060271 TaxID=3347089 RepID=UPI0036499608
MDSHEHLRTVVELLRRRAQEEPNRVGYRFLTPVRGAEPEDVAMTYGELDARARAVAVTLSESAEPGDRVLLMTSPGLDYVAYFYGCLYAGLVAVPAYPPTGTRHAHRIESIAEDSRARILVTDADLPEGTVGVLPGVTVLDVGGAPVDGREDGWRPPAIDPDDVAFLQYTSGSTSAPKGVMVTHANLLANSETACETFDIGADSVCVTWVPPYHDMGLIGGIVFPLYGRMESVLMAPTSFIRDPAVWLQAISRYRATHGSGPSFAYDLCVHRVSDEVRTQLDLSTWTHALNGAEPVRADVLDRFAETFASAGFRKESFQPCYGLAEGTLVVSGARPGGEPVIREVSEPGLGEGWMRPRSGDEPTLRLVSSGQVGPGVEVVVVDETTWLPVAEGGVGRVWVRGAAVAAGYFDDAERTARTFANHLASGDGPYLDTGDLGALVDGELFVTGRASDLMIFAGRNVYPQDVEGTSTESHPALAALRSAAFSVEHDGREVLVVVQEVPPGPQKDPDARQEIATTVRRAVLREHQIPVHELVLVPRRSLPVTSSGKIRRRDTKAAYLAGELGAPEPATSEDRNPVPEPSAGTPVPAAEGALPRTAAEIENRMCHLVARHSGLELARVDAQADLADLGLDSVGAVSIAGDLSDWLGTEVPATFAWEHGSIRAVAAALAGESPLSALGTAAATATAPATTTTPLAEAPVLGRAPVTAGTADPWTEPIAVVGIGCRFPGGVQGPEAFWDLLVQGRSGVVDVPEDRWDLGSVYDADPGAPGRTYSRHLGALDDVRRFDAGLFGIPDAEAVKIDPQHRLLLETAWESLEDAGIAPDSLRGSRTGVFVGMSGSDYERLTLRSGDPTQIDAYTATGSAGNFGANRISYALGLTGPSLVVDTACSSSLVAVHLAVQSLRSGEVDAALVGGVNLVLTPDSTVALSQGRMLSPDGACKAFDASADGYVRGDGCGVVVLRRLSDVGPADRVVGVIRGSAVNQDGRSNGLTAPSGNAQQAVVRAALDAARVAPDEVGYVEAHGTGTPLGDPIEVRALAAALGTADRPRPLPIGSVKTNIGHLEAAAGIAGLLKVLLAVERGTIPRHLNLTRPSPHIAWDELGVTVPGNNVRWADPVRVAGVSSFGFGGTNAHVVVQSPPVRSAVDAPVADPEPVVVKLSGADEAAVRATAVRLAERVSASLTDGTSDADRLRGFAWAAGAGRADLTVRSAVVAESGPELVSGLLRVAVGDGDLSRVVSSPPRVAFLAPGHGLPVAGSLAGIYGQVPAVTDVIDALGGPDELPLSVLVTNDRSATDALASTRVTQPALYAAAVALGTWWRSVGVEPSMVLGHSVGAYAAAALAGVFSVEDGYRLVTERGRLMADGAPEGAMVLLRCRPEDLADLPPLVSGAVEVAVLNGPQDTVVSGDPDGVAQVLDTMARRGVRGVRLGVNRAFHSHHMDPVLDGLRTAFDGVRLQPPAVPMVSDATGELAGPEVATGDYWVRHTREPVRFGPALDAVRAAGVRVVLELGPGGLLPLLERNAADGRALRGLASVSTARPEWALRGALARYWREGGQVDWSAVTPRPAHVPQLPTYPFQGKAYWLSEAPAPAGAPAAGAPAAVGTDRPATPSRPEPANSFDTGSWSPSGVTAHPMVTLAEATDPALLSSTAGQPTTGQSTAGLPTAGEAPLTSPAEVLELLRDRLAPALGLDRPDELDPDASLFDLGLTSFMVVELRGELERRLGREIPATVVFDHPTVRRLADHLSSGLPDDGLDHGLDHGLDDDHYTFATGQVADRAMGGERR